MKRYIMRGCPHCGGTLHIDADDEKWYRCMDCAREYLYSALLEITAIKIKHDVYDLVNPIILLLFIILVVIAGGILK